MTSDGPFPGRSVSTRQLKLRHVVVTGAGDGIGRATALRFLRQGAQVHGLDRNLEALQRVADIAATDSAYTGQFIPHRIDLANRTEMDQMAAKLLDSVQGRIDTLVNNAGRSIVLPFADSDDAVLDALFAVNCIAAFRLTRQLLPALRAAGRGAVINIASELALVGQHGYCAYSATKGAILAWSRTLAIELAPMGIRVNAICPGPVETALLGAEFASTGDANAARKSETATVPLGRLGLPADIAEVVVFLASDAAAFVTGALWPVDGGKTAA
jgi:NAD(P)-dependent dehydrogenase (short-subunit alcohol dehydrogenase family)